MCAYLFIYDILRWLMKGVPVSIMQSQMLNDIVGSQYVNTCNSMLSVETLRHLVIK